MFRILHGRKDLEKNRFRFRNMGNTIAITIIYRQCKRCLKLPLSWFLKFFAILVCHDNHDVLWTKMISAPQHSLVIITINVFLINRTLRMEWRSRCAGYYSNIDSLFTELLLSHFPHKYAAFVIEQRSTQRNIFRAQQSQHSEAYEWIFYMWIWGTSLN